MADSIRVGEIEESDAAAPLLQRSPEPEPVLEKNRSVKTTVPEAEVHIYRSGKGPIDVIRMGLGGWEQDQLEIGEILDKYGFKAAYAFTPGSGRGVPIRFNPRNRRSMLTYRDGALVHLDGEPKDSLVKPITRIILSVAVITVMIVVAMKETPGWAKTMNFSIGPIPPWILALAVIVFTRMRKRTKSLLQKYL